MLKVQSTNAKNCFSIQKWNKCDKMWFFFHCKYLSWYAVDGIWCGILNSHMTHQVNSNKFNHKTERSKTVLFFSFSFYFNFQLANPTRSQFNMLNLIFDVVFSLHWKRKKKGKSFSIVKFINRKWNPVLSFFFRSHITFRPMQNP